MTDPQDLLRLADEVAAIKCGFDNALDVRCEIALFEPSENEVAIRANNAGSKVIVTFKAGHERTYLAADYTISAGSRRRAVERLRARAHSTKDISNG